MEHEQRVAEAGGLWRADDVDRHTGGIAVIDQ
jgi:hypothetical protein